MLRTTTIQTIVVLAGIGFMVSLAAGASNFDSDDDILFFDTAAWLDATATQWIIPIHGWVYERSDSSFRKGILSALLKMKYGLQATEATQANFDSRSRLFLTDNERGKHVWLRLGERDYVMPRTEPNGHFHEQLTLPVTQVERLAVHGRLTYTAVLPEGDHRQFIGQVHLIQPTGLSVISDIDDTIKITHVTDRKQMFDHTFFQDFQAVPGMAEVYRRWAKQGIVFHFASASPWQLYQPLREFMTAAGFPAAALQLKYVRLHPADETFENLFKPSTEIKPHQIEPLIQAYPGHRFVLIGDSGEHDPEIYAAMMRKYPAQIARIYIRNVSGASADDEHFRSAFLGIAPDRWQLFDDPAALQLPE